MPPSSHASDSRPPRRRGRPPSLDRIAALDATRRVIASRGLDRTRYRDIAEESGVAVSTLQHAFGRLDEILDLALARTHEIDAEFLRQLPSSAEASAWTRIEAFVTGALASPIPPPAAGEASIPTLDSWLVWVELWRASARDPAVAHRTTSAYHRWWAAAEAIIADGQREGLFTDEAAASDLAMTVNAMLDGIAVNVVLRSQGSNLDEARRLALLATHRLLAA